MKRAPQFIDERRAGREPVQWILGESSIEGGFDGGWNPIDDGSDAESGCVLDRNHGLASRISGEWTPAGDHLPSHYG